MHDVNAQTAIDMANARARQTIQVAPIRDFLHHGHEKWQTRREMAEILERDPVFDKSKKDFMDRTQRFNRGLAMINHIFELEEANSWTPQQTSGAFASLDEPLPIGLHNVAFQPVFLSQGGPTLVKKYGQLIANRAILGCYLQTELGHGSNVASLETTATYIPENREFEIHSPTLTSSKWWIGALGKMATHGVVQAKLILPGGKDMGPHLFFMPLRSLDDHSVLPGRIIGDIGPKVLGGYSETDNGFARFDHVRIPKENMLSKFAQVTDDGKYIQPPHSKLSYGGMLYIRAGMVSNAGWLIAKAATVGIRYATVRRQGQKGPDGLECQIINHPSVHYRLLPILSHAYVLIQLGNSLSKAFENMSGRLAQGDTSLLAEMHATTSGLKVLASATGVQDIEVARRAMGGHGYSAFSGLGRIYADYLPSVTYEGDNFVLDQQVVRAALKTYRSFIKAPSAFSLSPTSRYLRLLIKPSDTPPTVSSVSAWLDPSFVILMLEWRAALVVQQHAQHAEQPDASVNQRVAKAVTEAFVGARVGEIIRDLGTDTSKDMGVKEKATVVKLYLLYLLTTLEASVVDLLSFGALHQNAANQYQSEDATRSLRMAVRQICQELLPEAIGLSDAFGYTDWELESALGGYDGKVYEALWKRAQTEPLNQTEVAEAYEESIKPILQRGQRQIRRRPSKL